MRTHYLACSLDASLGTDRGRLLRTLFADGWFFRAIEAGGDDEFQGKVEYTFTRPDGTQLGTQGMFRAVNHYTSVSDPPHDTQHTALGCKTVSALLVYPSDSGLAPAANHFSMSLQTLRDSASC